MGEPTIPKSETEIAIEKKEAADALFESLRDALFREAEELISENPATQIAILITPPAGSEWDVAKHSFGHPSTVGVLKTFLEVEDKAKGKEPMDSEKLLMTPKAWWTDCKEFETMNLEQLKAALDELMWHKNRLNLPSEAGCSSANPEAEA